MRFTPRFLEELRDRVRVTDVVGRKVKLVRRGRNHVGLCPFHTEKTPSFSVNADKGFYHCFGCGVHGDIISFVMETEGLSFPEAVEQLASQAGMALPARDERDDEREKARRSLYDVMELAAAFFENELKQRGAKARAYLEGRQLSGPAVAPFRLGFAPDSRTALKEHLAAKGVAVDDMVEAGLVGAPDDGGAPYDRFRGRAIFPITDLRERVIAFGGRTLDPEGKPKYLNSPETPLFKKSTVLFNFGPARKAVTQGAPLIAVEGYVDVIALVVAGFAGAVAPLGTALTEEHLEMMWRVAPEPVLCFDGDKAGVAAAQRAIDLAMPLLAPGQSLRFALLPEGQDPDDLIRARGASAMQAVLGEAVPLADMLWRREVESVDLATPERRAGAEKRILGLVQQIGDMKVREHYRTMMQERLRTLFAPAGAGRGEAFVGRRAPFKPFAPAYRPGGKEPRPTWVPPVSAALRRSRVAAAAQSGGGDTAYGQEALLLGAVLNHPFLLEGQTETLSGLSLGDRELDKLKRALVDAASSGKTLDRQGLRDHLTRQGLAGICERVAGYSLLRGARWAGPGSSTTTVLLGWLHVLDVHRRATQLEAEHRMAAAAYKSDQSDANFARMRALEEELKSFNNTPDRDAG